jgi:sRNA-binding protein
VNFRPLHQGCDSSILGFSGERVEVKGWHDAAYARNHVIQAAKQFEENKAKFAAEKANK